MRRSRTQDGKEGAADAGDIYLEDSDQHRGLGFSRPTTFLARHFSSNRIRFRGGVPPFHKFLTHGLWSIETAKKISKRKQGRGCYLKPQTSERYIEE